MFIYRCVRPESMGKLAGVLACWAGVISGAFFLISGENETTGYKSGDSSPALICAVVILAGFFGLWRLNQTGHIPPNDEDDALGGVGAASHTDGAVLSGRASQNDIVTVAVFCAFVVVLNFGVSLYHGVPFVLFGLFVALVCAIWIFALKKSALAFYCFADSLRLDFYSRSVEISFADIKTAHFRFRKKACRLMLSLANGETLSQNLYHFKREDLDVFADFLREKGVGVNITEIDTRDWRREMSES